MSIRESFRSVFDSDYCGAEEFIAKVIKPIFGEKDVEVLEPCIENPTNAEEEVLKKANIEEVLWVATVDRMGTDPIQVFDITLGDSTNLSRARVGIQRIIRSALFPYSHAFLIFHHRVLTGTEWRFSYVYKQDKNANTTDAKRYTYLFSRELHARTAIDRFEELANSNKDNDALMTAFNVEALSDEFFEKYRSYYAELVNFITGKAKIYAAFGKDDKAVRDYVKKLMGRITFLHFLQRKGWMNSDKNYMLHLFENSQYKSDYMDKVLEPLFFGILNTKVGDRYALFEQSGWDLSLLDEWKSIPYLNGGLFEQEPFDCNKSVFSKDYFKDYFARLFKFFSEYNFTVDENDPDDAEVGVDPEMLGKIFENLLEDNKDNGAFYTPKEIVRYMCQESLISYLVEKTKMKEETIRAFVVQPYDEAEKLESQDRDSLFDALVSVKICDPAIGSGAFPMGLLNELVRCEEALVLGKEENRDRAHLKREIIKNNIYGVDIEKGAIDIARLRFWLSLVVDEEKPSPLPNLDYKIMQGNSLLESYKGMDLSHLLDGQDGTLRFEDGTRKKLKEKLDKYYSCEEHIQKKKLQEDINVLVHQQIVDSGRVVKGFESIDVSGNQEFFLWHTWFSDVFSRSSDSGKGFDIVIGNPPYIKEYENRDAFAGIRGRKYYKGKMDIWFYFFCIGMDLLCPNGYICFIAQPQWRTSEGATILRDKICDEGKMLRLVDFGSYMVFDASTQAMILLLKKDRNDETYSFKMRINDGTISDKSELKAFLSSPLNEQLFTRGLFRGNNFTFAESPTEFSIISKISGKSNFAIDGNHEMIQGIIGGPDDAFKLSINESVNYNDIEKKLVKPFLTSTCRFYTPLGEDAIIYICEANTPHFSRSSHPNIWAKFQPYEEQLHERREVINNRKPWYSLWWERDESYFKRGEKIIFAARTLGSNFTYTDGIFYASRNCFYIKTSRINMKYLTGLLNSDTYLYYMHKKLKKNGDLLQLDKVQFLKVPLYSAPTDVTREIASVVDVIIQKLRSNPDRDVRNDTYKVNNLVYSIFGFTRQEITEIQSFYESVFA